MPTTRQPAYHFDSRRIVFGPEASAQARWMAAPVREGATALRLHDGQPARDVSNRNCAWPPSIGPDIAAVKVGHGWLEERWPLSTSILLGQVGAIR